MGVFSVFMLTVALGGLHGAIPPSSRSVLSCSTSQKGVDVMSTENFWKNIKGGNLIKQLDDSNYDDFVAQNAKVPVMYYATWCGYSKQARQGYAGAAQQLDGTIVLAAVDCDKAPNACNNDPSHPDPIPGYPTFYLLVNGQFSNEYNGDRTTDGFVSWLLEN